MIKFDEHTLVIGATGSGKGVLTTARARYFLENGMRVYALFVKPDEYEDFFPGHPRVFKTLDQKRLLEEVKKLKAPKKGYVDTMVIVDEAWNWSWKGDSGLQMIANAARSYGVEFWVQSQFPTQMAPTVRGNCRNRYVFTLDEPIAIDWAKKCLGDEFGNCAKLPLGRYIGKRGHNPAFLGCSFYEKNGEKVFC